MELQLKKELVKARSIPGYKPQYTRSEINKIADDLRSGICSGLSAFIAEQLIGHRLNAIAIELRNVAFLYDYSEDINAFEKAFKELGNEAARQQGLVLLEDDLLTRKNPVVEILEDIFSNIRWLQKTHRIHYIPEEAIFKLTGQQSKAFSALVSKKEIEKKTFVASLCQALQMDDDQLTLELWSDKEADKLNNIYQKDGEKEALRYLNKLLGGTLENELRERKPSLHQPEWGELTDILRRDIYELTHEQTQAMLFSPSNADTCSKVLFVFFYINSLKLISQTRHDYCYWHFIVFFDERIIPFTNVLTRKITYLGRHL